MNAPGKSRGWLALWLGAALLGASAAPSQEPKPARLLTAEQAEKIKERDRLALEANRLGLTGKHAEAAATMEKSVALHRELLGKDDLMVLSPLNFIAEMHEAHSDFAAACKTRREAIDILVKLQGQEHWQTADARRALAGVDFLEKLPAADMQQVAAARLLNRRIVALGQQGRAAEALPLAEKAAAVRKLILGDKHADYAESLNNLAEMLRMQGQLGKAEPLWRQTLDIWKQAIGENHPHYATAMHNLAELYVLQAEYAKAEPLCRKALAIRKQVLGEKSLEFAYSLSSLGVLGMNQGNYAEAEQPLQRSLEIRKQVLGERHPEVAGSLNTLASLYLAQGKFTQAEALCRQALEIRKQTLGEKHPRYADSLNSLAAVLVAEGDFAQAEPLYRQALEMRKAQGANHPSYATSLNNLAGVYQFQGDSAQAESLYRQALAVNQQALGEKHPECATILSNLAGLYLKQGNYVQAESLARQALEIRKQALGEKHRHFALSLHMLGELAMLQGDHTRAEALYQQALAVRRQALGVKHPEYAVTLNNLAELHRTRDDLARAEPLYLQALAVYKDALGEKHDDYATGLANLAKLHIARNDFARAEPLLVQALETYRQVHGAKHPFHVIAMSNLAVCYISAGTPAKAEPLLKQALELGKQVLGDKHPEYAKTLNNLARVYEIQGDHARAEQHMRQAVAIAREHLDLTAVAQSERQQLRMASLLRRSLDTYLSLTGTTALPGGDSYEVVLAWKGAITVRQQRLRLERRDPELAEQLRNVSGRLAALAFAIPEPRQREAYQQQFLKLSERKEQLEQDLARKSAGTRQPGRLTVEGLRQSLPAGTVLVDFLEYWQTITDPKTGRFSFERRLTAYIVPALARGSASKPGDIIRVDLGAMDPLADAIERWRETVAKRTRPLENDQDPAGLLRQKLWQPLERHLKGAQTVLISPDSVVSRVPLGALPGSKPGTFLIEETALVILPVPQLLPDLFTRPTGTPREALLLVGDVDYGAEAALPEPRSGSREAVRPAGAKISWPRLPGSKTEVQAIRAAFRQHAADGTTVLLQGGQATETAVRQAASSTRYLHLATHGFFADPVLRAAMMPEEQHMLRSGQLGREGFVGHHPGLLSGLVLAGANRPVQPDHDDGILTALEVAELDLQGVELAVLSSCESGLGATAGGEGVLGLQRAFQVAGTRNVVTSLWKVDDAATAALMSLFYHKLWQEKKPPLAALREAQLTLYHHPDRIAALSGERGPDFDKLVKLPPAPPMNAKPADKAPVRFWAAFVLSGTGK